MDNVQLYGFRWHSTLFGGADKPSPIRCRVASGYQASPGGTNVDLYPGDPVMPVAGGTVALATAGSSTKIYGVIEGFGPVGPGPVPPAGFLPWLNRLPGGTTFTVAEQLEVFAWVIPVFGQVFEVDVNDNTTLTTYSGYVGAIHHNADMAYSASSTLKKAFPKLNISTHNTTNTLQWRIVDIWRRVDIDPTGLNVKLLVTANLVDNAPINTTGT